jgi:hypothetical protein
MNSPKFPQTLIAMILVTAFLAGCSVPVATPTLAPTFPPLPSTQITQPPQPQSLFKPFRTVKVTPVGNISGGVFVRVGYVPGRDTIIVSFKGRLGGPEGDCDVNDFYAYAWREYIIDMKETGRYGIVTCLSGPDVGGIFLGNDFYYAAMGHNNENGVDGWWLAKYDAVTWTSLVNLFFYPLSQGENNGDPMIVPVNGRIDISGKYYKSADEELAKATHHQFFTPDLQFVSKRILTDTPNIDLSSLLVVNGVTNFITSTAFLGGDLTVMQYDSGWNYLSTKTLVQGASQPEGAAFDGSRYYVSYVDMSSCALSFPSCAMNIRLAAFDSSWNLLEDIPVTSFVLKDHKTPARPSLILRNNRIYVVYDQQESEAAPNQPVENMDIQVYVKVYELSQNP